MPGTGPISGLPSGAKVKGPVDHALDAGAAEDREAGGGEGDRVLDLGEVLVQKLVAEVPGGAVDDQGSQGFS
jgi:hypothetical protein